MSSYSTKILDFWRNLEIFNLPDVDDDAFPLSGLEKMPWEVQGPVEDEGMCRRFTLFIGRVTKNTAVEYLKSIAGDKEKEDWMEPVKGNTCLATITLNEFGRPISNSYVQASFVHGIHCLFNRISLSGINKIMNGKPDFYERYQTFLNSPGSFQDDESGKRNEFVNSEFLLDELNFLQELIGEDFKFEFEVFCLEREVLKDSEVETPIFNSLYIDDLEMLAHAKHGKALKQFLSRKVNSSIRLDLLTDRRQLVKCLHPVLMPPGKWPSSIEHGLYTAQRAAVNTAMSELQNGGMLGVNGPPGTGKTTLLLDVIADIVVCRARRLMDVGVLNLFGKHNKVPANKDFVHYYYDYADKSLFEGRGIVVASNNNKAVENISMELPSAEKIDRKAFPEANYFAGPAAGLLEKEVWAALSARLGNRRNRKKFRKEFWETDDLFPKFKEHLLNAYTADDQTDFYIDEFERTKNELKGLLEEYNRFLHIAGSYQSKRLKDNTFGAVHDFLIRNEPIRELKQCLQDEFGISEEDLVDINFLSKDYQSLHRSTPYSSPELNKLRGQIFIKSLKLHEFAIMANAKSFKGELSLFMEVLTGRMKVNNDVAEHLWNTFFFCVPVVSTTLASAGSLFSQMGPESIGWLLIDEAGQATPQSAVGLIYRSRRCIAVGDPLQIEPVVTHPQKLVELIRLEAGVKETLWSPLESSVQSLADRISLHGTMLKTDDTVTWSGFPLRAHRRCDDPMFSISNRIAYNGQMVKATDNPLYQCEIGQSCWFHFAGIDLKDKHVLLEEVKILEWLLTKLVAEDTEREVYVISPFVSVAEHCEKRFKKRKQRVTCGTIHAFQGREADIVLLVLGGNPDKLQAREWVTRNPNMINVAVTRAKHLFFIIGNHKLWGDLPFLRQVNGLMPIINFDMNNVK